MLKTKFVETLPQKIEEKMRKDLVNYESSHGVDVNYHPFAIILYDNKDESIGVLNAFTAYSEIYIDDLWVDSAHRNKGYGTKLLKALEDHFEDKGYNKSLLQNSNYAK